ncbi:(2Fe-2S)-binding protein [Streptomyces sp. NPDC050560]|uniref:(2Fe-2S)-binding protein n=1 Tax=Streptomyces sp. NPDC050560 TaxID=3365630 RepID=UPI00379FA9A9
MITVEFTFNEKPVSVTVPEDELLLDTLRDRLATTSARYSCGIGVCGACTVTMDGRAVSSCLQLTQMAAGRRVRTADHVLDEDGTGRAVRDAFVRARAFQCSYCIPAMALTVAAALDDDPGADAGALRRQLAGNLCRCGSYPQIAEAVGDLTAPKEST